MLKGILGHWADWCRGIPVRKHLHGLKSQLAIRWHLGRRKHDSLSRLGVPFRMKPRLFTVLSSENQPADAPTRL